jgi:hypothetical protein
VLLLLLLLRSTRGERERVGLNRKDKEMDGIEEEDA